MTIINTVEYHIFPIHGRFMIEEHLNGHYDSFRRALNADMSYFVGESFLEDMRLEATYVLTQNTNTTWTLATFHNEEKVSEKAISESKVRHLFDVVFSGFRIRTLGEDVDTNYEYRATAK
jgi:hypothetical protein